MARKNSEAGDLVRAVLPVITDLVPLFLEKWALLNDRPTIEKIEKAQDRLKTETDQVRGRAGVLGWICGGLIVWNAILTFLLVTKMH